MTDLTRLSCKEQLDLLDETGNEIIKKSISKFFDNLDKYEEEEIPKQRGILLYSIPGTGKSASINEVYNGILNFQRVEGPVQLGDAVFILISSKVVTPFRVENVGSGNTLGRDIEDQLIGMNLEEEKEVEENGNKYKITMKKISREAEFIQPPEKKEENNENR